MFKIIKITESLYDVFVGDGWTNWSRFKKSGKKLQLIKGSALDPAIYQEVYQRIVK